MIDSLPSPPSIQRQLDRILESKIFKRAEQAPLLLDLLVAGTLNGTTPSEGEIGIKLFEQPEDWVPDSDHSVVRTNISRLNRRLDEYYRKEGADDLVVITIMGREAVSRYNRKSPFMPAPPSALSADFVATLENYFADTFTGGLRCVVTGDPADWHHLDGDPYNNAIGNLIPLCQQLRAHIEGLRQRKKSTNLPELEPRYLAEDLARRHVANWRIADAYACAHLAFHMGEPPFGNESADVRVLRLCTVLSHARHRFNASILAYVVRNSLLPLIAPMASIDARSICQLAIQLCGVLDEDGYFDEAAGALAIAEEVGQCFADLVYQPASLNRFSLLRRNANILVERNPVDNAFLAISAQAEEQLYNSANSLVALEILKTGRSFRQGTSPASRGVYEALLPIANRFKDAVFSGRELNRPPQIDFSNVIQTLIYSGIAACRVRPRGWEEYAKETITKGRRLCQETGFRLPREFWETVSEETFDANPLARRISLLPGQLIAPRLRESSIADVKTVLSCLRKMLVLDRAEDALIWKSPWSGSSSRQD